MAKYAMTIAYDGTKFSGFQIQKSFVTVQGKLEETLRILFRRNFRVVAAGRTDAGVHASGQVISFNVSSEITNKDKFINSIHALAGPYISVRELHQVPEQFHARFDCIAREYEYLIYTGKKIPFFLENKIWHIYEELDLLSMQDEVNQIVGEHDFFSFSHKAYGETTVRYIEYIKILIKNDFLMDLPIYSIQIRGNAFLHNMVRIIVGSIVDRVKGNLKYTLKEILEFKDRQKAGRTAPAEGLYFRKAYYPDVEELRHTGLYLLSSYSIFGKSHFKDKMKIMFDSHF